MSTFSDQVTKKPRIPFPESWAGLQGHELVTASGYSDILFCHAGGFIAGARSKETVLKIAEQLLETEGTQTEPEPPPLAFIEEGSVRIRFDDVDITMSLDEWEKLMTLAPELYKKIRQASNN